MTDDGQPHKQSDDDSSKDDMQSEREALERLYQRGAEPYWMQDVRCAQRAIEAERQRQNASGPASGS